MVKAQHLVSHSAIELHFELPRPGFVEVSLFDERGNLAYNYSTSNEVFAYTHEIPLNRLSGAFYRLRAAFNGETILDEIVDIPAL